MASAVAKAKAPKAVKEKKAAVAKKPRAHPPYADMIKEAIASLKERTGSSQYAIAKFIQDKHKDLSPLFKKHISLQLKKLVASGSLSKVKSSFKLSAPVAVKKAPVVEKKKAAAATAKPKKAVVAVKPKAKAVEKKPKAKATKARKAVEKKPKAKATKARKMPVKKVKSLKSPVNKGKK